MLQLSTPLPSAFDRTSSPTNDFIRKKKRSKRVRFSRTTYSKQSNPNIRYSTLRTGSVASAHPFSATSQTKENSSQKKQDPTRQPVSSSVQDTENQSSSGLSTSNIVRIAVYSFVVLIAGILIWYYSRKNPIRNKLDVKLGKTIKSTHALTPLNMMKADQVFTMFSQ